MRYCQWKNETWRKLIMKQQLFISSALVIALTLTACNSNNAGNEVSEQAPSVNNFEKEPSEDNSEEEPSVDISEEELSETSRELVEFPENYDSGVHYTTVTRGNVREELFTSPEVIEAVQNGEPIPDGAVVTLEIYRSEELADIFVMEKHTGWADQNTDEMRNGDWLYNEFNADGTVDYEADVGRCFSCHANQERNQFMHTTDQMRDLDLEEFTGLRDSDTESQVAGIPLEHWEASVFEEYISNDSITEFQVETSLDQWNVMAQDGLGNQGSRLVQDEEKAEFMQKILLTIQFNQEV